MRVEIYGLACETPYVTVHLASPWRATFLEHRLFDAVRKACPGESEQGYDEVKLKIAEPKAWKAAPANEAFDANPQKYLSGAAPKEMPAAAGPTKKWWEFWKV